MLSFVKTPIDTVDDRLIIFFAYLYFLNIDYGMILKVGEKCLRFFGTNMERLIIGLVPPYTSLDYLFGYQSDWSIYYLELTGRDMKSGIIAPSNFTSLPLLSQLYLTNFGIETILDHSFDTIAHKLTALSLEGNHLKFIDSNSFRKIIEWVSPKPLTIYLLNNQFECNCDFYKIESIFKLILNDLNNRMLVYYFKCQTKGARNELAETKKSLIDGCRTGLQIIHTSKLCLDNRKSPTFYYPLFRMTVDRQNNGLRIKAPNNNDGYRLWVQQLVDHSEFNLKWGYSSDKCPKKGYIQISTKCLLLKNNSEFIPLERLLQGADTIGICVNYVSAGPKRFWPLHCITYSILPDVQASGISSYAMTLVITLSSLLGTISGLAFTRTVYRTFPSLQKRTIENREKIEIGNKCPEITINVQEVPNEDHEYESIEDYIYLRTYSRYKLNG